MPYTWLVSFVIRFSEDARTHIRQLSASERKQVLDRVRVRLENEPSRGTRHLKLLRPNPLAQYELRVGALRLFFEVDQERAQVMVLAIGRKEGDRLWIGGKEVKL